MKLKIILLSAILSTTSMAKGVEEVVVVGVHKDPLKNIDIKCNGKETPIEQRTPSPEIPRVTYKNGEDEIITAKFNSLTQENKECVSKFESAYIESVFQYCTKYNLAACIAGGCNHVAGYSLHTAVQIKAFESCNIKL